jgi:hypothetical protein
MRLEAAITGNLHKFMQAQAKVAEVAVTNAVKDISDNVKRDLRQQVIAAGLGKGVSNAWKVNYYPKSGTSISLAGFVFSKAPKIIRAFNDGALIKSKNGFFLAIPSPAAPKRGVGGKRITPSNFPEHALGRLRFVYRRGAVSLLVVDNLRASTGKRGGFRKASESALRTGRGLTTVVMFYLVPQVKMQKRLSVESVAAKWQARLPQAILDHWPEVPSNAEQT